MRLFPLAISLLLAFCHPALAQSQPPNILLIMVDDLGKEWIGCYGAADVHTPNIDRLAATGMLFENAWCMPQCTPTRLTLLTGQYPFRHGWVNHWDVPRWGGGCSYDPDRNPALGRVIRDAGYTTIAAGKWQIDDFRQEPDAMRAAGFDHYCMWTGYEAENPPSGERYWDPYLYSSETGTRRTWTDRFGPDVFADFLIEQMRAHRDRPWFAYYPMVLTHGPLVATPAEPDVTEKRDRHAAMLRYTDQLLGRLLSELDSLNLRQRTIVIWTTDNGTDRGLSNRRTGRLVAGGKARTTENGICVPFIVQCPGLVPAAVRTDALMDFTDLLPTLAEIAGAELPQDQPLDGQSFAPLVLGRESDSPRQWIMSMGGGNNARLSDRGVENQFWYRDRVLRDKQYKLYIGPDRQPEKFVDLQADPDEVNNRLDSSDPNIRAAFDRLMAAAQQFPDRDADPIYTPLPQQSWYRQPTVKSQTWKQGYPN